MITPTARTLFWMTPRPVRHFIRDRLLPAELALRFTRIVTPPIEDLAPAIVTSPRSLAQRLEEKLWGGFSARALVDLLDLRRHPRSSVADISDAAWALARWYACKGDYEEAYCNAVIMRLADRGRSRKVSQILLETDCLTMLGQVELAQDILEENISRRQRNVHLELAMANTFASASPDLDEERLSWINRCFEHAGINLIRKRNALEPLSLDNIEVDVHPEMHRFGPKVSIIIPTYYARKTLHHALDSLIKQTWRDIEIIVVDDCSPDGTINLAKQYSELDNRVVVIQQEHNMGAYVARNQGLAHATGEYITVHDADDWSHPQKIERQVSYLINNPDVTSCISYWVRARPNLFFRGTPRPTAEMVQMNHSSLMLRRIDLQDMGGWDNVRIAADTELIRRISHIHGADGMHRIDETVPLSLALDSDTSLTKQSITHVHTVHYGVRRNYREFASHWRAKHSTSLPSISNNVAQRTFPAPEIIRPIRPAAVRLEILLIIDTNHHDDVRDLILRTLIRPSYHSKAMGIMHWPHYDSDANFPIASDILEDAANGLLRITTPGERLVVGKVVAVHPLALETPIDLPPNIQTENLIVVGDDETEYDMAKVEDNLAHLTATKPLWIASAEISKVDD